MRRLCFRQEGAEGSPFPFRTRSLGSFQIAAYLLDYMADRTNRRDWLRIRLPNDEQGWIRADTAETL